MCSFSAIIPLMFHTSTAAHQTERGRTADTPERRLDSAVTVALPASPPPPPPPVRKPVLLHLSA